jgi:monofunctional biosynthetic peptidoglycan transglycosylase
MSNIKGPIKLFLATIFLGGLTIFLISILLVLPWRWIPPPTSAFMLAEQWQTDQKPVYQWVPLEEISPCMGIAVVAAEDQKFPHHYGFDMQSIADALRQPTDRPRGASTISQQVAKNLYLWNGRSYVRKGIEAWLTVFIETLWPKQRILEVYLNIAEFGPGIYGVGAASMMIWDKSPLHLTSYDCTVLAAVLPNPKRMSAALPSAYVQKRAADIRTQINRLGGPQYLNQIQ